MITQHTPGPWFVDDTGYRAPGNGLCVMAWPECIAVVGANNPHLPQDANARLIAAAPDLLEALQHLLVAHGEQLDYAFQQAQEAIAKATGETK